MRTRRHSRDSRLPNHLGRMFSVDRPLIRTKYSTYLSSRGSHPHYRWRTIWQPGGGLIHWCTKAYHRAPDCLPRSFSLRSKDSWRSANLSSTRHIVWSWAQEPLTRVPPRTVPQATQRAQERLMHTRRSSIGSRTPLAPGRRFCRFCRWAGLMKVALTNFVRAVLRGGKPGM